MTLATAEALASDKGIFKSDIFKLYNPKIMVPRGGSPASQIIGTIVGGAIGLGGGIAQWLLDGDVPTFDIGLQKKVKRVRSQTSQFSQKHKSVHRRRRSARHIRSKSCCCSR